MASGESRACDTVHANLGSLCVRVWSISSMKNTGNCVPAVRFLN